MRSSDEFSAYFQFFPPFHIKFILLTMKSSSLKEFSFLKSMPPLGETLEEKVKVNQWYSTLTRDEKGIVVRLFLNGGRKDVPKQKFYSGIKNL